MTNTEQKIHKIGAWLLDLLFPIKCPFCGKILRDPESVVCAICQQQLPWLTGDTGQRSIEFALGCCSPLAYRDKVPQAVKRYKFKRVRACSVPFGRLMCQCIQDHVPGNFDGVTWAPLSRRRLRKRGFDQAELLAREIGKGLGLPVFPTLKKTQHTNPQSHLKDEAARRANALGVYELLPEAQIAGKKLLLVDDVVTSGATLGECARLLKQAQASVYCVTLAQARGEGNRTGELNR